MVFGFSGLADVAAFELVTINRQADRRDGHVKSVERRQFTPIIVDENLCDD